LLFQYNSQEKIYACPGQKTVGIQGRIVALPPARSYSVSGQMNGLDPSGKAFTLGNNPRSATAHRKTVQINRPGPTMAFVFMDESEYTLMTIFAVLVNEDTWKTTPATDTVQDMSFADGHSEIKRWIEPTTGNSKLTWFRRRENGKDRNHLQWPERLSIRRT
jgi:hypothetical protein